jgi:hypothetical protein
LRRNLRQSDRSSDDSRAAERARVARRTDVPVLDGDESADTAKDLDTLVREYKSPRR